MRHLTTAALFSLTPTLAAAHVGHGFTGAHWHPSDLFLPSMLLIGIAAMWLARRK